MLLEIDALHEVLWDGLFWQGWWLCEGWWHCRDRVVSCFIVGVSIVVWLVMRVDVIARDSVRGWLVVRVGGMVRDSIMLWLVIKDGGITRDVSRVGSWSKVAAAYHLTRLHGAWEGGKRRNIDDDHPPLPGLIVKAATRFLARLKLYLEQVGQILRALS